MFDDSVSTVYSSIWASMNSWFTPTVLFVLLNVMIGTIAFTSSLANQKQNHPKQQQEDNSLNQQEDYSQQQQPPKLVRSPSLLQRIRSINFYNYRSQEPVKGYQQETPFEPPTHYIFEPAHEHTTVEPEITQYIFNQENNVQKAETHQQNLPDTQTQYLFHEQNLGNMESTQYIFQHTDEQKPKDSETHFDFEQIEEENEDELQSLDEVYSQLSERHVTRSRSDTNPSGGEAPAKLPTKMKKSASMKSPFAHFEEEAIVEARRPATTKEKNAKTSDGDSEVDARADDFINKFKQQLKLQRLDSILRYKEMIGRGS